MIQHFTAHTINCVCHSKRSMFRVLGKYNIGKSETARISWWWFDLVVCTQKHLKKCNALYNIVLIHLFCFMGSAGKVQKISWTFFWLQRSSQRSFFHNFCLIWPILETAYHIIKEKKSFAFCESWSPEKWLLRFLDLYAVQICIAQRSEGTL